VIHERSLKHVLVPAVVLLLGFVAAPALGFDRDLKRDRSIVRTELLGRSVRGRPITVLERGDPDAPIRALVIGCIHGNEPAGIGIAEQLE